ncbi:MAG TPA: chorismate synthase [Rectinemataceae bacterium]|nr:chorismate synthase [Rectinemataceae bacterium]
MNTIGSVFRVSLFGESHGPAVGAVLDGLPPGIPLEAADFETDLARRRSGAAGTTPRRESDIPEFLSGLWQGHSTGSPLVILFRNADTRSSDYERFLRVPRPGHADFSGSVRYKGWNDPRGSGHFSGRITAGLVAAGVVAKKMLGDASFATRLLEAGGRKDIEAAVREASEAGDSIGGLVEIRVRGLSAGLGEPFFGSVEGLLGQALFSVPGVRGLEFGDGFAAAGMRGSEHNDPFVAKDGRTAKNGAGGVNGGITNGNELLLRIAVKPASSIARAQRTLDFSTGEETSLSAEGRHDACIALRAAVVLEAAVAVVLADLALVASSRDSVPAREKP